jgi:hypothetical protein
MEELRREKEKLRDEKNDILIKLNKQIETEKTEKRHVKAELDKSHIRIRQLENEISHIANKYADKDTIVQRLTKVSQGNSIYLE